ncbi:hypothetical protein MPTK1_3g16180 [Marchantia polymorpha subsp. ruderalis]|uniref:Uncharacterized protein n=2 Tax=Marchantia polymorpha TaxID=3197 RepID=A0AAF6B1C8_MARPO|nr:hypothetical protein MARPO_0004s0053 [Marchantia polymorpha]BBN05812.1 hypothetical protein Mp_3g16180 [Marchantia polymorpha subsp. ruderalis]|eukprot:PTQ48765.1 hypothetical protein MARPO_0004s0053 [Marchantia polymorpha]
MFCPVMDGFFDHQVGERVCGFLLPNAITTDILLRFARQDMYRTSYEIRKLCSVCVSVNYQLYFPKKGMRYVFAQ